MLPKAREIDHGRVQELLAQGKSRREIASLLGSLPDTFLSHYGMVL